MCLHIYIYIYIYIYIHIYIYIYARDGTTYTLSWKWQSAKHYGRLYTYCHRLMRFALTLTVCASIFLWDLPSCTGAVKNISFYHCICHLYWPPFVRRSVSNQPEANLMHSSRHLGPDRPWGPSSLLYDWYRVSFPEIKRPGRGVDHPPSSSTEVKEKVELYFFSPSGPSWLVLGWNLPLPFPLPKNLKHNIKQNQLEHLIHNCTSAQYTCKWNTQLTGDEN